jgi:hypothetical protein
MPIASTLALLVIGLQMDTSRDVRHDVLTAAHSDGPAIPERDLNWRRRARILQRYAHVLMVMTTVDVQTSSIYSQPMDRTAAPTFWRAVAANILHCRCSCTVLRACRPERWSKSGSWFRLAACRRCCSKEMDANAYRVDIPRVCGAVRHRQIVQRDADAHTGRRGRPGSPPNGNRGGCNPKANI